MLVTLNGKEEQLAEGTTLAQVVEASKLPLEGLIVVIGDDVIPSEKWSETVVQEGNFVELLNFVSGG